MSRRKPALLSPFEEFLDRELRAAYHARLRAEGWWCGRCDVRALPFREPDGPGWCRLCGMDPSVSGPPYEAPMRGLSPTPIVVPPQ